MGLRIGLTGGIGSGKSTVAAMLVEQGAALIDADAISRACTAAGGAALPAIAREFGPQLLAADGALDRAAMRELVFRDPGARQRLEAIVHPLVGAETERQARQALAPAPPLLVFDTPPPVESTPPRRQRAPRLAVVHRQPGAQIARAKVPPPHPRAQVEQILAAQASRAQRLAVADAVIFNGADVTLQALRAQVRQLVDAFGI